ncbi:MAG: PAS domain-containing methyl-accepting chemotaxis protein [Rubripirellula sp.]
MNAKLLMLSGVFAAGFLIFGAVTFSTLSTVKVDGPHYNKIAADKNLMADILPPPAFIIESSWVTRQLRDCVTTEQVESLKVHFERLKGEYEASIANWNASITDPTLKNEFLVQSQDAARSFFKTVDEELFPAALAGEDQQVEELIRTKLDDDFKAHFAAINRVVERNKEIEAEDQAHASATVTSRSRLLLGVAFLVLCGVAGFTVWLRRGIIVQEEKNLDFKGQLTAINRSQAVIEFDLEGNITNANENFLKTVGYTLDEITGRHHSMFVDDAYRKSAEYAEFWPNLAKGNYVAAEFKRIGKGGKEIWIQASYNAILDSTGKPCKVVKYATDVTEATVKNADFASQIAAINKSQAVIEFDLKGNILSVNENFLNTLGYSADEVVGRHHSIFVEENTRNSVEYREFWENLGKGINSAGEFKRVGKGGKEVWIQASYNPVYGPDGKPLRVIKYASDATAQKLEKLESERVNAENSERERMAAEELRLKVDNILSVVNAATGGDLTQDITVEGSDAVGQMGEGLQKFFSDLRNSIGSIGENASALAGASEELSAVSSQMSSNAEETSSQANVVSAASEQVSMNVQTVSTGVEELNAAIREIAKNASDAARVSQQAVTVANTTNATISKLGDSSLEIGKVVKVITSIAEQTNLLALNATIEAARAGEAGKGFAVVANEVKELAKETAKATEDISQKIDAIQGDTQGAVDAIREISEVINQINDISNTIASAVEEQTATANEMGRNVSEAARGASEIAQNITSVATAAESTTQGAGNSQQAAGELSRMASDLQTLISRFKYQRNELTKQVNSGRIVAPVGSTMPVGSYQSV